MATNAVPQAMDLTTLPLEKLKQLQEQTDGELQAVFQALQNLQTAFAKFGESKRAVSYLNKDKEDRELMVPLTNSLYVPGKIVDSDSLLVDIGTGYYVQRTQQGTVDYLDRRLKALSENIAKLQEGAAIKRGNLEAIQSVVYQKQVALAAKSEE